MARWINLLILSAVLVASCFSATCDNSITDVDLIFWDAVMPLSMFSFIPIFIGTMIGLFARGRIFARPSIDKLMMARNSPLQFIWFSGMIFCAAGIGNLVGCLRDGISADGVVILASGIGAISGSKLIVKVFSRRFVRTVLTQ